MPATTITADAPATITTDAPALEPAGAWEVHSSLEVIDQLYTYNHWLFNAIRPHIRGSVFEVGCGIGNVTQFLLNQENLVAIEPFAESLRVAQRRFAPHLNVRIYPFFLNECPNQHAAEGTFDTVISLNVLEHIEDDVDALDRMRRLCKPEGRVVILVPAHMSIYGELDRSFAHCRRYSRRTLRKAFEAAGLTVERSFYKNAIGYFGWLWHSRVLRRAQIPANAAHTFNKLVPAIDLMERILPPPFGQSLIMVGTPAPPQE